MRECGKEWRLCRSYSVQGNPLKGYGKQYPHVTVGNIEGAIEMTVTDAAESLVSVNAMLEKGHEVHLSKEHCYVKMVRHEVIPLEKYGKRWYLRVTHGKQANEKPRGNGIAPVKAVERSHEDGDEPDEWSLEIIDGEEYLLRTHNKSRVCLFMPSRMKDLPVKFERILPGRLTKLTYCKDGVYEEHESNWTNKRQSQKHMGKVWIGQTFFKFKEEDEPEEEVPKEPNPEVVQEEGLPDGIFNGDEEEPQTGFEPAAAGPAVEQPVRREIVEHPNAVHEGQAGEPRAEEEYWHQDSQHQKKVLKMSYTTRTSSHGVRNVSWGKDEINLTGDKKNRRNT